MNRIYEALKRSDTPDSNTVLDILKEVYSDSSPQTAIADVQEDTAPAQIVLKNIAEVYNPAPPQVPYRTATVRLHAAGPIFPFDGTDNRTAEQYRMLRTNIIHHAAQPRMVVVTSAEPGDGKTVTAINLAGILALKTEVEVLLVEGDLRRGILVKTLGLDVSRGLADVLRGTCSLEDAIVRVSDLPNLHVLPAGTSSANPTELLDSPVWTTIASVMRHRFRYIVIDSTPIDAVADFELLRATSDGVILVIRPDHTNRNAFSKALAAASSSKFLGVVVNAVDDWPFWKTRSAYQYEAHP